MSKIYMPLIAGLLSLLFGGCSDFLEGKSQDEVIVTTTSDYSELLMGAGYPETVGSSLYSIISYLDDDVDFPLSTVQSNFYPTTRDDDYFARHTWQPDLYEQGSGTEVTATTYYKLYQKIMGCNAVLDGIDEALGAQEERSRVKAEALALLAFYYFILVNIYGQPYNYDKEALGVPLKLTAVLEDVGKPRNTVAEVYDQILTDLTRSEELFTPLKVNNNDYRINLPSVQILLSRVYLFMEEWEQAAEAATRAMKHGIYLADLTTITEDNAFRIICYDPNGGTSEVVWSFGGTLWNGSMPNNVTPGPSDAFLNLCSLNSADCRFGEKGFFLRPRKNEGSDDITGYKIFYTENLYGPFQALRMSEAYLNRAEANAQLGGTHLQEALNDLNELRSKRIEGYVSENDVTGLLENIRKERRLELCFTGLRWFDLRRYGMPAITHYFKETQLSPVMRYTLQEKDPMYTLPIPNSILLQNNYLESNPSNGGPERIGEIVY